MTRLAVAACALVLSGCMREASIADRVDYHCHSMRNHPTQCEYWTRRLEEFRDNNGITTGDENVE